MIAMQMTNEHVVDFTHAQLHSSDLLLRALSTVNQKIPLSHF
jgi:hypothetical protein